MWSEEAVIRCNGSSFFMFYQHPTPTPKSPLSPRGDFDFFFAAGCFGCGVRFALQSSTRLRYRSLQSLLMLALCRGKAMGLTILFPMENRRCRKREQLEVNLQLLFSFSRCYHGETLHCGYGWEKGHMGTARPQTPATSPKNSWWLRLVWGRLTLTVRTGGGGGVVKKMKKIVKTLDIVCTM